MSWIGFAVLLVVVYQVSSRWGKARWSVSAGVSRDMQPLQAGLLIWIGMFATLLLHHGVSGLREKTLLVHEECDSVAQVFRRLETLPPTHRAQMRLLLSSYLEAKLRKFSAGDEAEAKTSDQEILGVHAQIYTLTIDLANRKLLSEAQGLAMEAAINRMISLHFRTDYALREHLPAALLLVLALQLLAGAAAVGYCNGFGPQRRSWEGAFFLILTLSLTFALWEVDDAAHGLVQADISNWRDLVALMHQRE